MSSYPAKVAWSTNIYDVSVDLLDSTVYYLTVVPIDVNQPGAATAQKAIGFRIEDFVGHSYLITAINVNSDPNRIKISDDLGFGAPPQNNQEGFVYATVGDGGAPVLAPVKYDRLNSTARDNSWEYELDIIWKNLLHLNQTIPQTITGGIPLMDSIVDPNGSSYQLINKDYADKISSGVNITEYFTGTLSSIGGIYNVMQVNDPIFSTLISATLTNGNNQNYRSFATTVGQPGLLRLLKGTYSIHVHLYKTGTKSVTIYYKLFQRKTDNSETLLATFETTPELGLTSTDYDLHAAVGPTIQLSADGSDRLVIKAYANVGITGSNVTIKTDVGAGFDSNFSFAIPVIELATIFEEKTNKVTSISAGSTDIQYPSAKLVYDQLVDVVRSSTDTYVSVTKALYVITLTQAEYDSIVTKNDNTLYVIP